MNLFKRRVQWQSISSGFLATLGRIRVSLSPLWTQSGENGRFIAPLRPSRRAWPFTRYLWAETKHEIETLLFPVPALFGASQYEMAPMTDGGTAGVAAHFVTASEGSFIR